MSPSVRLQATLDLLSDLEDSTRPADAVTSAFFRSRRHLDDKDRGEILELLFSLLRHQARLGWWLDRQGQAATPRTRLLAWLVLAERRKPSDVARLFSGARNAPSRLTEAEGRLVASLQGHTPEHPDMPEDVRLECPPWAAAMLRQRFGPAFESEMSAALTPPPLDLRVNTIKATRELMLRRLSDIGLPAEAAPLSPFGIRLWKRMSLGELPGLKTGEVEIQDEGSQLVALLVDARPGHRVADFCAGAGGKTLAIAAQMNNKGHIVACDVSEGRLKRCAERLRRAGLHNGETRVLTSETDRWVKRKKGSFDRVLVDAPCSGTGTWRRNPDARWRDPDLGLDALMALQARILVSAARLVKPGGRLVYATCSVLPGENEQQVQAFLAASPDFRLVPLAEAAPQMAIAGQGEYLSLTPAQHDTDGFFAAVLERGAAAPAPQQTGV